jgi:hypothetical protein
MIKKGIAIAVVLMMILSGIVLIVPNTAKAEWSGYSYVWDGEGANNLASTKENWYEVQGSTITNDIAPTSLGNVIFNGSSIKACTWDITTLIYNFTMAIGYSGALTQSETLNVDEGGIYLTAGSLTLDGKQYIYNKGNFYQNNGNTMTSYRANIVMQGEGKYFTIVSAIASLRIAGNTTILTSVTTQTSDTRGQLIIDTGKICTLAIGKTWIFRYYSNTGFYNNGTIKAASGGSATLTINLYNTDRTIDFGNIQCDIAISSLSVATGNRKLILSSPLNTTGYVSVASSHSTYTMELDTNAYNIRVGGISVGTRGIITPHSNYVYNYGVFDTSMGTWNSSKCHLVSNGINTFKMGYGQSIYNWTINTSATITLSSNVVVNSWCYLKGWIVSGSYTLTAPMYSTSSTPNTTMNEGELYDFYMVTNVTTQLTIINNYASFLHASADINGNLGLNGLAGPADSGTYAIELRYTNAIGTLYINWTLTVNNTIFCYFDSEPETDMTVGEMYNYHPEIVCNGTYTFWINDNGALVVSNATGNVTGSPIAGIYNIELRVIDSSGNIAYQNWTLTVSPFVSEWSNDKIVDIALLVIIMGIITLFNYLGYVKNSFLLQILSFIVFIFVLVPLWPGSEIGGLLVLVFGIGNIGLLIGGLMK